jgi:hypothetical protein
MSINGRVGTPVASFGWSAASGLYGLCLRLGLLDLLHARGTLPSPFCAVSLDQLGTVPAGRGAIIRTGTDALFFTRLLRTSQHSSRGPGGLVLPDTPAQSIWASQLAGCASTWVRGSTLAGWYRIEQTDWTLDEPGGILLIHPSLTNYFIRFCWPSRSDEGWPLPLSTWLVHERLKLC